MATTDPMDPADPSAVSDRLGRLIDSTIAAADAARSGGDILRLRDRLNRGWDGAKPGAHLPSDAYAALRRRCETAHARLTERFVALRDLVAQPEPRVLVDPDGPTVDTFFEADVPDPDWVERAEGAIGAAEARLGVRLPEPLRALYRRRNGGATDFFLAADVADAPLAAEGEAAVRAFDDIWRTVLPGFGLTELDRLETLGVIGDGIDFGGEEESWRAMLPGIDRLVPISNHGSDLWLCLDYAREGSEPSVFLFDATSPDGSVRAGFRRSNFASFFRGLRRHDVTVEDGVAMRGLRVLADDA